MQGEAVGPRALHHCCFPETPREADCAAWVNPRHLCPCRSGVHSPGLPAREPQEQVIDGRGAPVADSIPVLPGEGVGREAGLGPPESLLQGNLLEGGQDI